MARLIFESPLVRIYRKHVKDTADLLAKEVWDETTHGPYRLMGPGSDYCSSREIEATTSQGTERKGAPLRLFREPQMLPTSKASMKKSTLAPSCSHLVQERN